VAVALALLPAAIRAQDRLKTMPGYDRVQRIVRQAGSSVRGGSLAVTWVDAGSFEYTRDGKRFRFDIATREATETDESGGSGGSGRSGRSGRFSGSGGAEPERGRQFESALSPDGTLNAFYRDRNVWLSDAGGANERAVTTDGSVSARIKYGIASWVYGEELSQQTAMWWSPDNRKLAYYRFDESKVPDYYMAMDQTNLQSTLDVEAYPKAGAPNPTVDLFIYDVASKQSTRVDVRDGKPFDNTVVGHYVYHVEWAASGRELVFFRTNRRQNIMEVAAADASTGKVRVVLREEWPTGWVLSEPRMAFLSDGHRFVWESQRSGWNNFYLHDLSGKLLAPLTRSTTYEASALVKINEQTQTLFYTARDGDNPLKLQLHRVGLDGRGDRRITDPAFHHSIGGCIPNLGSRPEQPPVPLPCSISPDDKYVVG
jgi:dipeptidyl-peptidase 4